MRHIVLMRVILFNDHDLHTRRGHDRMPHAAWYIVCDARLHLQSLRHKRTITLGTDDQCGVAFHEDEYLIRRIMPLHLPDRIRMQVRPVIQLRYLPTRTNYQRAKPLSAVGIGLDRFFTFHSVYNRTSRR